jgi:isocitrate dehydrogenase kinase/phosphatase
MTAQFFFDDLCYATKVSFVNIPHSKGRSRGVDFLDAHRAFIMQGPIDVFTKVSKSVHDFRRWLISDPDVYGAHCSLTAQR